MEEQAEAGAGATCPACGRQLLGARHHGFDKAAENRSSGSRRSAVVPKDCERFFSAWARLIACLWPFVLAAADLFRRGFMDVSIHREGRNDPRFPLATREKALVGASAFSKGQMRLLRSSVAADQWGLTRSTGSSPATWIAAWSVSSATSNIGMMFVPLNAPASASDFRMDASWRRT